MTQQQIEQKLTPAARQALDELLEDYKRQILRGAEDSASRLTGEFREISLHDIVASLNKTRIRPLLLESKSKTERLLTIYVWTGLIIAGSGFSFFFFKDIFYAASLQERIPLLLGLTGISLSAIAFIALRLKRERSLALSGQTLLRSEVFDYIGLYISKWRDLEIGLRDLAALHLGESSAKEPISVLLDKLSNKAILSIDDRNRFRKLLDLRNQILHKDFQVDQNTLFAAIRDSDSLIWRIGRDHSHSNDFHQEG